MAAETEFPTAVEVEVVAAEMEFAETLERRVTKGTLERKGLGLRKKRLAAVAEPPPRGTLCGNEGTIWDWDCLTRVDRKSVV